MVNRLFWCLLLVLLVVPCKAEGEYNSSSTESSSTNDFHGSVISKDMANFMQRFWKAFILGIVEISCIAIALCVTICKIRTIMKDCKDNNTKATETINAIDGYFRYILETQSKLRDIYVTCE